MGNSKRFSSGLVQCVGASLLLAFVIFLHEASRIDFAIQDTLYLPKAKQWLVRKDAKVPRILFYHGPKVALIGLGSWWLISAILVGPRSGILAKTWKSQRPRCELVYLLICLAGFPVFIGALKKASGVFCPSELTRYGGDHAFRRLIDHRPPGEPVGHCFPAGHASGGFALLGLVYAARTRRARARALLIALGMGVSMGTYQILVGAHFLTHTFSTGLLAWLFTATSHRMLFSSVSIENSLLKQRKTGGSDQSIFESGVSR